MLGTRPEAVPEAAFSSFRWVLIPHSGVVTRRQIVAASQGLTAVMRRKDPAKQPNNGIRKRAIRDGWLFLCGLSLRLFRSFQKQHLLSIAKLIRLDAIKVNATGYLVILPISTIPHSLIIPGRFSFIH
ncbi:MAG: hypothetical protein NT022_12865 [Deltaproteobacteria bacterium]|nr:hypothetical protein [Deltaproteobacteria bacterium]